LKSSVFFTDLRARKKSQLDKVNQLFKAAGFADLIKPNELVALKVHFGERGSTAFIPPLFIRRLTKLVRSCQGKPFLTDTNTLYLGGRFNAVDHIETAYQHGFDWSNIGAPVIIADGLSGQDYLKVPIDGKHFKEVKIATAVICSDTLIVASHFKGHGMTGFGGSLKSLGMGFSSRSGKQEMHSEVLPTIDLDKCSGCGRCLKWCPADAIKLVKVNGGEKAQISDELCYGCGECRAACLEGAVSIDWASEPEKVQEKMAEYAYGVMKQKKGKIGFFNFLINITPDCDCWTYSDSAIVPDIGILASKDPVAIDQASLDLINQAPTLPNSAISGKTGRDKFKIIHGISGEIQLSHAEKLGIGSRDYELVEIGGDK
jgi:hypothetical protein